MIRMEKSEIEGKMYIYTVLSFSLERIYLSVFKLEYGGIQRKIMNVSKEF